MGWIENRYFDEEILAVAANSNKVPDAIQPLYESIASQTDIFCREMLNEECAELCRKVAAALARKRPTPLVNGKAQTWACGWETLAWPRS